MSHVFTIYVSNRSDPADAMMVRDIAIEASQNNRTKSVSGILMAVGSYFLQVLEGKKDVVDELLMKISKDPRHTDVRVLYQGTLPDRVFGQWSMGCVQRGDQMIQSDQHFDEIREQIEMLCHDINQEKSERLRDLIVQIPKLLAENKVAIS